MRYTYFPGCSLTSSEISYNNSLKLCSKALGIELQELDDWNCCGATIYPGLKRKSYLALAVRNLALAEKYSQDLVTPCNGCFAALTRANLYFKENKGSLDKLNTILKPEGLSYDGNVRVRHFLEVLINDLGLDKIKDKLKRKLSGLKVVCYYGCQYSRPLSTEHPENPHFLENLMSILGAEVKNFSLKTDCCGGILTLCEDASLKLVSNILNEARDLNADCIITVCPLCQVNLELYQRKIKVFLPIIYFTQLLGFSLGVEFSQLGKEISPLKELILV